jgi:hypothetical protein
MGKMKQVANFGRQAGKTSLRDMMKGAMEHGYYDPDIDDVDYRRMSADKKWLTKSGEVIDYKDIETSHLLSILSIFAEGKFLQRRMQERGLIEELLSRKSKAGKVLFGSK